MAEALSVLVISDGWAWQIGPVRDHLDAFRQYSRNRICHVRHHEVEYIAHYLNAFDVIVLHYSVVIANGPHITPRLAALIRNFRGYKVLFIQDEYRWVNDTVEAIRELGVDVIYSVLNEDIRDRVYHHESIRHVRRKTTLTGFVAEHLTKVRVPDYSRRPIDVGYRARRLPASLGAAAQEKWLIGERFKQDANAHQLTCDIEHDEYERLYGREWIRFILNCKAVLGTESAISHIDFDGCLSPIIDAYEKTHLLENAFEIQAKFLHSADGALVIRVISPRCFEAAALRTLMILYPGRYSGVLKPWRHYVELERDHSNMNDVVAVIRDSVRAGRIIDAAYHEVALNSAFGFGSMIEEFDRDLVEFATQKAKAAGIGLVSLGVNSRSRAMNARCVLLRLKGELLLGNKTRYWRLKYLNYLASIRARLSIRYRFIRLIEIVLQVMPRSWELRVRRAVRAFRGTKGADT